jgi:hypothetical protein
VLVDQPDDLPVDLAGEHHPDHVHGLGGGDPQPGPERALDAQAVELGADLRPAAVHHDGQQPGVAQEHDVLREGGAQRVVGHGVAAVLDDDGLAVEPLQPGQRLDQGGGLGLRASMAHGNWLDGSGRGYRGLLRKGLGDCHVE